MEQIVPSQDHIPPEAEVFRRGRRGMGWSQEALAETILVPPETVQRWEEGYLPIPPKVIAWVGLYARSYPIDITSSTPAAVVQ